MKSRIFYLICSGFTAGVLYRSFLPFDFRAAVLIGLAAIFLIFVFSVIYKRYLLLFIFVFALAFSLGVIRFNMADKPAPEIFTRQINQKISLLGTIIDQPAEKENGAQLAVETEIGKAKTKILIFAKEKNYKYGDKITFTGKLQKSTNFLTDQGKEFDYVNYLKKDGIFFVMYRPKIEIISHGGNFLKRELFSIREKITDGLNAAIGEPESILMRGLILGERASFSEPLRQAFVTTGLVHIIAVSGYNVTLVAGWIMEILGFLPIKLSIGAGIVTIFLYVIITGGTQTAIRAGIMASLIFFARASGRMYNVSRALVLAAAVMIFVNPLILVFDVSFELSFLATIAVIYLTPEIEKYFLWIKWKSLREITALTGAAYIFVLPFIIYKIGNLSLVALPANLAVLPFIPITMIMGFITGFLGIISNFLAILPGTLAYFSLRYELSMIGFFSRLPFASLSVPYFPLALVILIYAILFYYLFRNANKEKVRPRFVIIAVAFFITVIAAGSFSYRHYEANQTAKLKMQALLTSDSVEKFISPFVPDKRTKTRNCEVRGPLPDRDCTPGAVFENAAVEQICVKGYTKTVRNVSTKLRKAVFAEYGIAYPQPRGAYEVDHLIPLALGGSNDIANLFPEAAEPVPGFHEKDIVEVYLQREVCSGRVILPVAQKQVADNWLAVYNNLTPEEIASLKKKYGQR